MNCYHCNTNINNSEIITDGDLCFHHYCHTKLFSQKWVVKTSAVYYTIFDETDNLIAFMSLTEDDRQMAEYICKLHNDNINKNS